MIGWRKVPVMPDLDMPEQSPWPSSLAVFRIFGWIIVPGGRCYGCRRSWQLRRHW